MGRTNRVLKERVSIYDVAINDSGTALIAGFSSSRPFVAFVSPDGHLTKLKQLPNGSGFLDGIALDPSGYALVGGQADGAPFLALADPKGRLVYLDGLPERVPSARSRVARSGSSSPATRAGSDVVSLPSRVARRRRARRPL